MLHLAGPSELCSIGLMRGRPLLSGSRALRRGPRLHRAGNACWMIYHCMGVLHVPPPPKASGIAGVAPS
jgi:hypothetical protein